MKAETLKDGEEFMKYLEAKKLSDRTIEQYMLYHRAFRHEGEITKQDVIDFLARHSHNTARAFLVSYFDFKDIPIRIPKLTGRKKVREIKILSPQEIEVLREAMYNKNEKYGLMFDLNYGCGLRLAELVSITLKNFKIEEWKQNPKEPCQFTIIGKGNRERSSIFIDGELMNRLREWLKKQIGKENLTTSSKIFKIGTHRYWEFLRKVSIEALGRSVNPHLIRHTRTSHLWETGIFNLVELQQFLGHKNIATTEIYVHPDQEKIKKKFKDYIGNKT